MNSALSDVREMTYDEISDVSGGGVPVIVVVWTAPLIVTALTVAFYQGLAFGQKYADVWNQIDKENRANQQKHLEETAKRYRM